MTDPYDVLFVDEQEPKEEIAKVVGKFLKVSKGTNDLIFTENYHSLTGRTKFLLHLLFSKVLVYAKLRDKEGYTTSELSKLTGIVVPTLEGYTYGCFKKYVESDDGRIFIPNRNVNLVIKKIQTSKGVSNGNKRHK